MAYECLEYEWNQFDQHDNRRSYRLPNMYHDPRRRRSASRKCSQQTPWETPPFQLHFSQAQYVDNENNMYGLSLRYGADKETIPYNFRPDNYYMDSALIQSWSRPPQQFQQKRCSLEQPEYDCDDEDDPYFYNGNDLPTKGYQFNNKATGGSQYFDPMTTFPLPHQFTHQNYTSHQPQPPNTRTQHTNRESIKNYQPRHSLNLDFADYYDDDDALDSNNHYQTRRYMTTHGKKAPRQHRSLQYLRRRLSFPTKSPINSFSPNTSPIPVQRNQYPALQPIHQVDTQRSLYFCSHVSPQRPSTLPVLQPIIYPSSLLPYQHSHTLPQFGYGVHTRPSSGSIFTPGSSMSFTPMAMIPPSLPPPLRDTQINTGIQLQQTDVKTGTEPETTAASPIPHSRSTNISQDSPNGNSAFSPPATSSLLSSASAPAPTKHRTNGENTLAPLVRSLSLGDSQPLGIKPRRRSLFGNLFNLDGFRLSRNNSVSTNDNTTNDSTNNNTTNASTSLAGTTISSYAAETSSSSSMILVHELTTQTLSRKQSLSLEKKLKALSQRSYIWCYQIKTSPEQQQQQQQQQQQDTRWWVAMTPRNQTKLDPYIRFYYPNAMIKGTRMDNLSTLVTLDKEPKLIGSFTAIPQAKIARVYPSMFSSNNYTEVLIDCLPADNQFIFRSG